MVDTAEVTQWLGKLREGARTEADLKQALEHLEQGRVSSTVQRLVYVQTQTTERESPVPGMSNGKSLDWPCHAVLEAMDERRIVKFPELALAYLD